MESSQQVLLKELSDLLGFEDGAEDVLDHLMTIDSRQVRPSPRVCCLRCVQSFRGSHCCFAGKTGSLGLPITAFRLNK